MILKRTLQLISLFILLPQLLWADVIDYTYDDLGRLLLVEHENGIIESYTYDAHGNRLRVQVVIPDDLDTDGDGVPDNQDTCPFAENDFIGNPCNPDDDADGIIDANDACPFYANDNLGDPCVLDCADRTLRDNFNNPCDHDEDRDGIHDDLDDCPRLPNDNIGDPCNPNDCFDRSLRDALGNPCNHNDCADFTVQDDIGNACDHDEDNDGIHDLKDQCPFVANDNVGDPCKEDCPDGSPLDNIGDPCDHNDCPNANPRDNRGDPCISNDCPDFTLEDGIGDTCNHDEDGDGVLDLQDACPFIENDPLGDPCNPSDCADRSQQDPWGDLCNHDEDDDGILDDNDNCPFDSNPNQDNFDQDIFGDLCDDDIDGDGIDNLFDQCPETDRGQEVSEAGCSENQSLCDRLVDIQDSFYQEEICYLLDQGHWKIEANENRFRPNNLFILEVELEILLSLGGYLEEARGFEEGLCPQEPLLSFALDLGILSGDRCFSMRSSRTLHKILSESSNLYLLNLDNLVFWNESLLNYDGPNLEGIGNPYAIDLNVFKVAHQRNALIDYDEDINPHDGFYGRQLVSREEAAYIIYRNLGLSEDDDGDGLLDEQDPCPFTFSPLGICNDESDPGYFSDINLLRAIIRAFNERIDVSDFEILADEFPAYVFEDFDLTNDEEFNINDVDLAISAFLNDPFDFDEDGLLGFYEIRCQYAGRGLVLDPRLSQTYTGFNDGDQDCDGDGLSNIQELQMNRDPLDFEN